MQIIGLLKNMVLTSKNGDDPQKPGTDGEQTTKPDKNEDVGTAAAMPITTAAAGIAACAVAVIVLRRRKNAQ